MRSEVINNLLVGHLSFNAIYPTYWHTLIVKIYHGVVPSASDEKEIRFKKK